MLIPDQVPVDSCGNVLKTIPEDNTKYTMQSNPIFSECLKFVKFEANKSHTCVVMENAMNDSKQYRMFLSEFQDVIAELISGTAIGRWAYIKRSNYYGLKYIDGKYGVKD